LEHFLASWKTWVWHSFLLFLQSLSLPLVSTHKQTAEDSGHGLSPWSISQLGVTALLILSPSFSLNP
jgi:hypothetical protein